MTDLQDALQQIVARGLILHEDEATRRELSIALRRERLEETYKSATGRLVELFQEARQIPVNGAVDELTAKALNALLDGWGLFDRGETPRVHVVSGRVLRDDRLPLRGVKVRAFHEPERGAIRLGEDTTDAEGQYTIRYEVLPGVDSINLRVSVVDESGKLLQSSEVIRGAKALEVVDLTVPIGRKPATRRSIEGQILLEDRRPADGVTLRLYRRDFGGKATLLDETRTLAGGQYAFTYDAGDQAASLEVRAVRSANEEIPLSRPVNDRSGESRAGLNLVAPANLQPLAAEYKRLADDLTTHLGSMAKLAEAKEDDQRQDLTILNGETGWDARLIALAATSERLGADAEVQLPKEAVYGLLRAGLPSDKLMLAQIDPEVAGQALKTVRDAGVVGLDDSQIADFTRQFAAFAIRVRLNVRAPGSPATYGQLLAGADVSQDARDKFAPVYLRHRGPPAELWDEARKAGVGDADIRKLQQQGKLAFLAGNSAAMTERLLRKGVDDPAQLVEQDLHKAATWAREILHEAGIPEERQNALSKADMASLERLIPTAYAGGTIENRLAAYADDMAGMVKVSYPTHAVARMIAQGEMSVPAGRDSTVKLLRSAAAQGFRLGQTPVSAFLKTHPGVAADLEPGPRAVAEQQMRTLHRVYQVTPSNEAMAVLMSLGTKSAYDVMVHSEDQFRSLYERKYFELYGRKPPKSESHLVYRRAGQVSAVTYNLFTIARKLDSEPQVAGLSAPVEVRDSVRNELIRQFPTMESLFGSMDFCECEHCRTVLSPAAYLVDLLQFLEPEVKTDANAVPPYEALIARRPDLPHIPLTCENTHTALPYIDVVNEILEYYVANGKLDEAAARDTGGATTAELLAEPQNVIGRAYDKLRDAHYPLSLPYDLWIETVRQFCDFFETPLARVLEVLRPGDDLFAPAQPFDRSSIFFESLGLSSAELAIFADPEPLKDGKWVELYGFPADRPAIGNPANVVHATLTIPNAGPQPFREGMVCTYFDVSANALSAEAKTISSIGGADSGGPGRTAITFEGAWNVPPEADDLLVCNAVAMLQSAKTLSLRLGVAYKEISAIVESGFVNPKLSELTVLDKLGVSIHDVRFYLEHEELLAQDPDGLSAEEKKRQLEVAAFRERLEQLAATFATTFPTTTDTLEAELRAIPFGEILVLADDDAGCNFDRTLVQNADGTAADPIVFLRINLFVRLWRKLGWTIDETDRALVAFMPRTTPFETANLEQQPLKTALISIAHLRALTGMVRAGKQSRITIPTLWSDLPTTGPRSLYAQLFLTKSVLATSPVFDHPLGKYLTADGVKLKVHLLALQGALGLTAEEIGRILDDAGMALDTTDLTLPNVSLLYRYGLLAKALRLPVRDLIALRQLSGLDPFQALHPDPLTRIEEAHPFTQTLRFVEVVNEVRESGLTIEDLDYLLRHRFDRAGKYREDVDGTMALLKTLAEGIGAIRTANVLPDDPAALTEEVLREKLGLALKPEVVSTLLGMVNGTVELTAMRPGVETNDQLAAKVFADEPRIRVHYNAVRSEQQLTVLGVLSDPEKTEIATRFAAALTEPQSALFANLLGDVERNARELFDNQLKKQTLRLEGDAGFLDDAARATLFLPLQPLKNILATDPQTVIAATLRENDEIQKENLKELQRRRARIAEAFLPFLQRFLIRQFVVQTLTAHTGAEPALVESLLTDERLLSGPGPLLDKLLNTFSSTGERGVEAHFFDSTDGSGTRQATSNAIASADTALKQSKDSGGLVLSRANSARFAGTFEVPAAGAYRFSVELERQGAEAELRFDHLAQPLFFKETAQTGDAVLGTRPEQFLELKPGISYRFSLDLKQLSGGHARLFVQGETLPRGPLSQLAVHPTANLDSAKDGVLLLTKAVQLVQGLGLSERETRYLFTHPAAFGDASLSRLPTRSTDDTPARTRALFDPFLRLAAYARLKRDLAGGTDDLIAIFEANGTTAAGRLQESVYPLIARLTRREPIVIQASAEGLFAAPSFDSEQPLQRLWEVLQIVERFGVPVRTLKAWTRIVSPSTGPEERSAITRDVREAIKARFEPEAWQRVAKPIFDRLRKRQRDALVSHVTHQQGFASIEQLYEYFLVDPGMEPMNQTSRIRLAIASVQLFIQRCLLNMELHVRPSAINAGEWEWKKRYRVWEANRKIFLFPENWLEPEFRDDKTHLFAELEGALLQGDVSSDLVEDAFFNYLKKLDELARLDIVAMHIEDHAEATKRTLHVIGRTYTQPHKYFYRRRTLGMWTPWEPVSAEIEGDHLAPVVWRDRLYLFWLTFMDKPDPSPPPPSASENLANLSLAKVMAELQSAVSAKLVEVHLHWSEYVQGEWSTRESGGSSTAIPRIVSKYFTPSEVFIHVSKDYEDKEERGVYVNLTGSIYEAFYLAGRNSAPERRSGTPTPTNPYSSAADDVATRYRGNGALKVSFQKRISTGPGATMPKANPSILEKELAITIRSEGYTVVPCNNELTSLGVAEEAFEGAENQAAVQAAHAAGIGEIASLMKPVFYQDNANTFFVEPSVTEQTIEEWQDWITRTPLPDSDWPPNDHIAVSPGLPNKAFLTSPTDPSPLSIDTDSLIQPAPAVDWLVNPATALLFDGVPVGPTGRPRVRIRTTAGAEEDGAVVQMNPAGGLPPGNTVVLIGGATLEESGLTDAQGGLNVIGSAGFNPALDKNFRDLNRLGRVPTSGGVRFGR
ncbi:MAG TPA: neuraminidase-like domain-containing protein [Thermoanaerobaculia bacterium]|nr:neuraminidase-like domain-containing protein [Thermoanaerobaculia bacterium]